MTRSARSEVSSSHISAGRNVRARLPFRQTTFCPIAKRFSALAYALGRHSKLFYHAGIPISLHMAETPAKDPLLRVESKPDPNSILSTKKIGRSCGGRPRVVPHLHKGFVDRLEMIRRIPHYTVTLDKFGAAIATAEAAHFANVVTCRFDDAYLATLLDTCEIEAQPVSASALASPWSRPASELFGRRCRKASVFRCRFARTARAVSMLFSFDVANAPLSTIEGLQARERANRRHHVRAYSSDFDRRIGATMVQTSLVIGKTAEKAVLSADKATHGGKTTIEALAWAAGRSLKSRPRRGNQPRNWCDRATDHQGQ